MAEKDDIVASEKQSHKSQLTGKTFYDMSPVELTAHQMARGVPVTSKDKATLLEAQTYLIKALRDTGQTVSGIRENNADRMGKQYV